MNSSGAFRFFLEHDTLYCLLSLLQECYDVKCAVEVLFQILLM